VGAVASLQHPLGKVGGRGRGAGSSPRPATAFLIQRSRGMPPSSNQLGGFCKLGCETASSQLRLRSADGDCRRRCGIDTEAPKRSSDGRPASPPPGRRRRWCDDNRPGFHWVADGCARGRRRCSNSNRFGSTGISRSRAPPDRCWVVRLAPPAPPGSAFSSTAERVRTAFESAPTPSGAWGPRAAAGREQRRSRPRELPTKTRWWPADPFFT